MFGKGTASTSTAIVTACDPDRDELLALRKEKTAREAAERVKAEQRAADKYKNRTWVSEGKDTNVQSLVIDGGKLWRINNQVYFQPITTTTNYYGALSGLAAQANAYNTACYTATSVGSLQRL